MSKMIKCKTCNNEIASSAKTCPSCGAKNKKPIYKKWWAWAIAVIVVVGFAGGSETDESSNAVSVSNNNTTVNGETDDNTTVEVKEFYAIGEEVQMGDNILIVNSVEKSSGSQWDKPKDGHEFITVSVTIKNGGSSEISYNPYDFKMQNSQGQITDNTFTTIDNDTALSYGNLASGGQVSGTISFEQPVGDEALVLKYQPNFFSSKEIKVKLN